jgi:hypothetical protein
MISHARKLPVQPAATPAPAPAKWDHKKYGTLADPVHKSHMSTLIGEFACTEQFRRDRIREAQGEQRQTCSGKTEMGTAGHNAIRRALAVPEMRAKLLAGPAFVSHQSVRSVLETEFSKATTAREVVWYGKAERDDVMQDVTAMLVGLFADMHRHVAEVVLVEAGWIAPIGKWWSEGHIDLVYRPRSNPTGLGITDWKTGATKPHPIELDHGFESGLYSNALQNGYFLPEADLERWIEFARTEPAKVPLAMWDAEAIARVGTQREAMHIALRGIARMAEAGETLPAEVVRFGQFPDEIRLTHLADYVPYARKGDKAIKREEELEHWSRVLERPIVSGEKVKYEAGQARGPAWYRVRRTANDVSRLENRLRAIVGWVRFGLFVDAVGEKCERCSYRESCLTSGYEAKGEEAKALQQALAGLDVEGIEL